jgi:hypothetical protein
MSGASALAICCAGFEVGIHLFSRFYLAVESAPGAGPPEQGVNNRVQQPVVPQHHSNQQQQQQGEHCRGF